MKITALEHGGESLMYNDNSPYKEQSLQMDYYFMTSPELTKKYQVYFVIIPTANVYKDGKHILKYSIPFPHEIELEKDEPLNPVDMFNILYNASCKFRDKFYNHPKIGSNLKHAHKFRLPEYSDCEAKIAAEIETYNRFIRDIRS